MEHVEAASSCRRPKHHPPDLALALGTCLWMPTGLPSRSLQMLQTLGHYREQGQAANLHHIIQVDWL